MRVFMRNFKNQGECNNTSDYSAPRNKDELFKIDCSAFEAKCEKVVNCEDRGYSSQNYDYRFN